jgi:hypothetical protein
MQRLDYALYGFLIAFISNEEFYLVLPQLSRSHYALSTTSALHARQAQARLHLSDAVWQEMQSADTHWTLWPMTTLWRQRGSCSWWAAWGALCPAV